MTDTKDGDNVVTFEGSVAGAIDAAMPATPPGPPEGPGQPQHGDGGPVEPYDPTYMPPDCPVTPIGLLGDLYFYIDANQQLRAIRAKDHSRLNIWALCGNKTWWLYQHFPRRNKDGDTTGWQPEKIAERLMQAAAERGVTDAFDKVRGAGGWLGQDFGLVLHCGDVVISGGEEHKPGVIGDHIYPAAKPGPRPALSEQPAGDHGPGGRLKALFEHWNWRRPDADPQLLLGWCVAAMASGALDWRPLVWITGDRATGKSTLQKVLKFVFDGGLIQASDASAAGIWQKAGQASLPIALDEVEAKEDNRRTQAIVELARQAASGGLVLRGGADHSGAEFVARSCFLFSSINVLSMLAQDRSRMAVLELQKLTSNDAPKIDAEELAEIGAGLRRRLLDHWPRMQDLLQAWRAALEAGGHDGRGADVYGTLLACADLALSDVGPSADDVEIWCEHLDALTLAADYDDAGDHDRCLQHLLTSVIDPWRNGALRTIADWLSEAAGRGKPDGSLGDPASAKNALETHGLKVTSREGYHFLAVATNHQGLSRIFKGTKWEGQSGAPGGWNQSLQRVPRAAKGGPLRFNGVNIRVTLLPVEAAIGDEDGGA